MKKVVLSVCVLLLLITHNISLVHADNVPDDHSDTSVAVYLLDSNGNVIPTGSLKYYENGSWQSAPVNAAGYFIVTTSASTLSYQMTYEHGSVTKSSVPVTTDSVAFQTKNVTVQLKNSLGDLIDEGTVEYYAGGWHEFGTTSGGIATKELLSRNYTFRMMYEHGSNNLEQDVSANSVVEFQTVKADIALRNSSGDLIDEGAVEYYSGEWHELGTTSDGIASKEMLPKEYTFRMIYEHGSNDKSQDIGADNLVEFQTVKAEAHLLNSMDMLIDDGSVQYYAGGWHDFGATSEGVAIKELLPKSYTFRMTYEHGSNNKAQDIGTNTIVEFQTVKAEAHLKNSSGDLIDEGAVQYYAGGWHNFGTTNSGIATKELLPRNYTFRMTYEHGSNNKAQNIGADQIVPFSTVNVTVQLENSAGSLIDPGTVTYYAGGWHPFGTTSGGETSKELLPRSYTFRMSHDGDSENKAQDVGTNPVVIFQAEGTVTPPVLTITEPAPGTVTQQDSIIASGTVDNPTGTTVTVNGQASCYPGN